MNVCIYARYSSENQSEESITAQLRACTEYAQRNGHVVVEQYIDRAMTARSDKRPAFQQMIADSKQRMFQAVIVHKLDRFSRDRFDHAIYRRELKQAGVKLLSVLENLDDSPESVVLESVLEGFSEYYSKNLSRETRKGLREAALDARYTGGNVLYGYQIGKDKRYEINQAEAAVVRKIFHATLSGSGYNRLLDELRINGVRTRTGKIFTSNQFYYILKNPRYTGDYVYSPVGNRCKVKNPDDLIIVPNAIPAIVSHEDYEKVQSILKARSHGGSPNKAKEPYLLSGILYCGECGGLYAGHRQQRRKDYVYYSYECTTKTRTKQCSMRGVPRDRIETAVCDYVKRLLSVASAERIKAELLKHIDLIQSDQKKEIEALQQQLDKLSHKIDKTLDLLIEMQSDSLKKKLGDMEAEKNTLELRIEQLEHSTVNPMRLEQEIVTCLNFDDLSREEKQQIIKKVIKKVTIHEDGDFGRTCEILTVYSDLLKIHDRIGGATAPHSLLCISSLQSCSLDLNK